jgi:hypothetical protein
MKWLETGKKIQALFALPGLPCPQYGLAQPGVMDARRLLRAEFLTAEAADVFAIIHVCK